MSKFKKGNTILYQGKIRTIENVFYPEQVNVPPYILCKDSTIIDKMNWDKVEVIRVILEPLDEESKFTVEEIRNYIASQDSRGDIMYYLSADNIRKANQKTEE